MYTEKKELLEIVDLVLENEESLSSLSLTDYEKDMVTSIVSRKLDINRTLSFDEYCELLEHNVGKPGDFENIDFNDEILSIEEVGEIETFDIQVDGNHLFYANDILTHNSSYDNLDSGLDSIADSLGVIQTADVVIAILSNGQLREYNQSLLKFLKNRNTGKLTSHLVEVDFGTTRYTDLDDASPGGEQKDAVDSINASVLQSAVDKNKPRENIMNFD